MSLRIVLIIPEKTVLNIHSKTNRTKTDFSLKQVESIAECSKGSILQHF